MSNIKSDAMINRLEKEVEERNTFIEGLVAGAQDQERDLTQSENELLTEARKRIEQCETQLTTLSETRAAAVRARKRVDDVDRELTKLRGQVDRESEIEYRSAGEYVVDAYAAYRGDKEARDRLEIFNRTAAHQRTTDNEGLLPDPVVGPVLAFIDSARPLVQALGVQPLTTSPFARPKVTQHTQVGRQTDGTTDDIKEKVELASRKMTITRLPVEAETYGGYVNISRQNLDFSSPQIFDIIVNDLAAQYAIETEEATADAIEAVATAEVEYPLTPTADELATAIWTAAAQVYAAAKGQGRLILATAPDRLAAFGPLFAPYGPQNQQGSGFSAASFGQGPVGNISGIPVYMSGALTSGYAALMSTAALELWEQRVGVLQVVEPSVLGLQVAYAGYFATLVTNSAAIVPLDEGTA